MGAEQSRAVVVVGAVEVVTVVVVVLVVVVVAEVVVVVGVDVDVEEVDDVCFVVLETHDIIIMFTTRAFNLTNMILI